MSSQQGDYIGQGGQYLITLSDGAFTLSNSANVVGLSINNGDYWDAGFAGPTTVRLGVGDYENAQRYPFQPAGTPGLDVSGAGRGCNTLTGNFQVLKAGYNSSILQSFSANFEQHCEGAVPALFGWLRNHTVLQQFSVSNAVISGPNATFTVTLNPASETSVFRQLRDDRWHRSRRHRLHIYFGNNYVFSRRDIPNGHSSIAQYGLSEEVSWPTIIAGRRSGMDRRGIRNSIDCVKSSRMAFWSRFNVRSRRFCQRPSSSRLSSSRSRLA